MTPLVVVLLAVHVALALSLLLPAVLLPLGLRAGATTNAAPRPLDGWLAAAQGRGAPFIGLGLAATGISLVAALSIDLGRQPWLLVALAIYALDLAVAMVIQRPRLRRLAGIGQGADPAARLDDAAWRSAARRLRLVSYGMAVLIGAIAFLMMAKPHLW